MENILTQSAIEHTIIHCIVAVVMWLCVILAIFVDLWDGIYTARVTGQRIHSHKMRVTIEKIAEYWRLLLIGFIIDTIGSIIYIFGLTFYALPYLSVIFALGLIGVEGKSLWEHMKERKSRALELKNVLKMVVECANEHDAQTVISTVAEYLETNNKKK